VEYVVRVFEQGKGKLKHTSHVATVDGDENKEGTLWNWLWRAKRENLEITVYRLVVGARKAKPHDEIAIITAGDPVSLVIERAKNLNLDKLADDRTVRSFKLSCVLDLS
jgi:hypothetical protein